MLFPHPLACRIFTFATWKRCNHAGPLWWRWRWRLPLHGAASSGRWIGMLISWLCSTPCCGSISWTMRRFAQVTSTALLDSGHLRQLCDPEPHRSKCISRLLLTVLRAEAESIDEQFLRFLPKLWRYQMCPGDLRLLLLGAIEPSRIISNLSSEKKMLYLAAPIFQDSVWIVRGQI